VGVAQVTEVVPHLVVSASQHVAELQVEEAPEQRIVDKLAFDLKPAGQLYPQQVAFAVQQSVAFVK
jgi:hypothetical protein